MRETRSRTAENGVTGGRYSRSMSSPDRRRRSRSGRLLDALVWGTALGAAAGAVIGAALDGIGPGVGALLGVLVYAPAEALTSLRSEIERLPVG